MNPDIKKRWINALLSGDHPQGQYRLRTEADKFCCLGVLCDLYLKDHQEKWVRKIDTNGDAAWYAAGGSGYLPEKIQEWAGLSLAVGWSDYKDPDQSLINMNDTNRSFEDIAKKIQEKL